MKPFERDRLLERIDRDGATVGASIPDQLSIAGETVDLAAFVHDASDANGGPSDDRIREVIRGLRAERKRRRDEIETGELSTDRAEELADSILGIDRALTVLESDTETDIEAESERQRQADRKRWLSFLNSVTGKNSNRHGEGNR
ncbi:MAG: DUF5788 family protein [Halodesulfurarchaeum sp.]|nr:DUF5788 family protein [Halodesulfurarchaeum sp.]